MSNSPDFITSSEALSFDLDRWEFLINAVSYGLPTIICWFISLYIANKLSFKYKFLATWIYNWRCFNKLNNSIIDRLIFYCLLFSILIILSPALLCIAWG